MLDRIIAELNNNQQVFKHLFSHQSEAAYLWRPQEGKWNLLEIICHLYDEEIDDFRYRIQHLLTQPDKPMPGIDPEGWVLSRNYASQNYEERLQALLNARAQSVEWLQSLENPEWDNHYIHPNFGKISAKLFLNNWLAHDYLHIRQILSLKYAYLEKIGAEPLTYAGGW